MILFALALAAAAPGAGPAAPMTPASVPGVRSVSSSAPAVLQAPVADANEVVCHEYEVTGTRLGSRKECRTKREWFQMQQDLARGIDEDTALKATKVR